MDKAALHTYIERLERENAGLRLDLERVKQLLVLEDEATQQHFVTIERQAAEIERLKAEAKSKITIY